jgi:hypothetical protein
VESYGEGERAHRTAFSALKHSYEKVGDHWEPKAEKGPSDAQAARAVTTRARRRARQGASTPNASKRHLYELAQRLEVPGRSRMSKQERSRPSARRTTGRPPGPAAAEPVARRTGRV